MYDWLRLCLNKTLLLKTGSGLNFAHGSQFAAPVWITDSYSLFHWQNPDCTWFYMKRLLRNKCTQFFVNIFKSGYMQIWAWEGQRQCVCVYVSDFDMEVTNMHLYFFWGNLHLLSNVWKIQGSKSISKITEISELEFRSSEF